MTETASVIPWLSFLTFSPLIGVLLIILRRAMSREDEREAVDLAAKRVALLTTSLAFIVSLVVYFFEYDTSLEGFQLVESAAWIGSGIGYKMGVDGASILFVLLTTFIMPICIIASWNSINKRVSDYMIAFLILETMMIGVFCALDLVLFYVFFEGSLIPMCIIIGVWGSEGERTFMGRIIKNRVYASFKFFLYTLLGSLLMLVALIWMYLFSGSVLPDGPTTDIPTLLSAVDFPGGAQTWLWLAFFASFAVKMPMWPVHTWLPDAHVQAPTAGSVVLAAILLKMGGYGFIRFSLPMFPIASDFFAPLVFALSVIAIIYTSLVAFAQEDMKKLIAYSSVAHMGFVTMGIFSGTEEGVEGALFQMLSHGFISGALFLCVGVVYDRMHTREIAAYGGLVQRMPFYAFFFMFFTMGNVGLPGISGFVGEMLTMVGVYKVSTWTAALAAVGLILSAAYGLRLYREVIFGTITREPLQAITDVNRKEAAMLLVLMIAALYLGLNPTPTLDVFSPAVDTVLNRYDAALTAVAN
ncbi:MAG: NADH-quinone oxidoreductase subunit M [Aquisalinus sp.]|nr:NADH-quinone oxidoreductase subunit M [Aquisalinus sp.]